MKQPGCDGAVQETAKAITYTTGWTHQAVTGAYGGSVKFATATGKKATFKFTGKQVAWVSTIASNRGRSRPASTEAQRPR